MFFKFLVPKNQLELLFFRGSKFSIGLGGRVVPWFCTGPEKGLLATRLFFWTVLLRIPLRV